VGGPHACTGLAASYSPYMGLVRATHIERVGTGLPLGIIVAGIESHIFPASHAMHSPSTHHSTAMRREPKRFFFEPDVALTFVVLAQLELSHPKDGNKCIRSRSSKTRKAPGGHR
jgi:hypothetical protein